MPLANAPFVERRAPPPHRHPASSAAANAEVLAWPGRPPTRATPELRDGDADRGDRDDGPAPPDAAVVAALARVLASPTFRPSERHRTFLRYIVDATLAGREQGLKEVVIGLDVFGRSIDRYDPRRDSIVRVEARRLRMKLARYYAREGRRDAIEIRCTAGSYVPRFVVRDRREAPSNREPLFVVLPFAAVPGDAAASALALGLADRLADGLGLPGRGRVMTPPSSTRRQDGAHDFAALADHGVDYVVDGCVLRSAARLRCTVHLSRTGDRLRVWTAVFDFGIEHLDPFAVQDEIAAALAEAVAAERRAD